MQIQQLAVSLKVKTEVVQAASEAQSKGPMEPVPLWWGKGFGKVLKPPSPQGHIWPD